jgi:hypothetical protein
LVLAANDREDPGKSMVLYRPADEERVTELSDLLVGETVRSGDLPGLRVDGGAVEEEPADNEAGRVVPAHDLAPVAVTEGLRLHPRVGMLDRGEPAPFEDITGADRVDGTVRDAADRRRRLVRRRGVWRPLPGRRPPR